MGLTQQMAVSCVTNRIRAHSFPFTPPMLVWHRQKNPHQIEWGKWRGFGDPGHYHWLVQPLPFTHLPHPLSPSPIPIFPLPGGGAVDKSGDEGEALLFFEAINKIVIVGVLCAWLTAILWWQICLQLPSLFCEDLIFWRYLLAFWMQWRPSQCCREPKMDHQYSDRCGNPDSL